MNLDKQQSIESGTIEAHRRDDLAWLWPKAHLILLAIFFLALLPMTWNEARYHGDELFYTDGALGMMQSGDYITPHYSNGVMRFRKPVLAYWVILASYKLFGVSLFASRIPFLFAGCLVIWFTYQISRTLLQSEEAALAAIVILFSNLQLFTLATRSTPDILQCAFLTASLYGFSILLFSGRKTILDYACAYVGSGLAIATKGLLGIFPVLFSFLLSVTRKGRLTRPKDLVNLQMMLIGAGVALLWFVLVFFQHGLGAITGFLGDQVTERMSGSKLYVLENIFAYLLALIRHFAPWSIFLLLALPSAKSKIRDFFVAHKEANLFIVGWYALLFMIFIWANIKRTRYLFPSYPLLAILLSALLVNIMRSDSRSMLIAKLEKIILLTGLVGSFALAVCGALLDVRIAIGGVLLFLLTLLLYRTLLNKGYMGGFIATGTFLVLLFSIFFNFVRPVFYVSPARAIAQYLAPLAEEGPVTVASIDYPRDFVHQVVLFSGGKIWVRTFPAGTVQSELKKFPAVILAESARAKFQGEAYEIVRCGYSYRKWKARDIVGYLTAADKEKFLQSRKEPYFIALTK